jgi:hypothetical protein
VRHRHRQWNRCGALQEGSPIELHLFAPLFDARRLRRIECHCGVAATVNARVS